MHAVKGMGSSLLFFLVLNITDVPAGRPLPFYPLFLRIKSHNLRVQIPCRKVDIIHQLCQPSGKVQLLFHVEEIPALYLAVPPPENPLLVFVGIQGAPSSS